MPDRPKFPPETVAVLRDADRTIRRLPHGDHRKLYNVWRVNMSAIAPVDAFYVGFFAGDRRLVFPYLYDEQEWDTPGFHIYSENSVAAWIRSTGKTYFYSSDRGRLLNRGHRFGNTDRLSKDALVIPLLGPGRETAGIASMQTYRPDSYVAMTAEAFSLLARTVMTVLGREEEDESWHDVLADFAPGPRTLAELIDEVLTRVGKLRRQLEAMAEGSPSRNDLLAGAQLAAERCRHLEAEIVELMLLPAAHGEPLLAQLTPREREVAELMADGLSNEQIAERLVISPATVKTHVTRILRKFDVRQRSAVAAKLRPHAQ